MNFDIKLTFEDNVLGIVNRVSQRFCILRLVKLLLANFCFTLLLLCICAANPWVYSPVWDYLPTVTFNFSGARCIRWKGFFPNQGFLSLSLIVMLLDYAFCTRFINPNHCLFDELPSACFYQSLTYRPAVSGHPLKFQVPMCRTSQFATCFLPAQVRMWNDLYTLLNTGMLNVFKEAVNRWLLLWVVFLSVFRGESACGVANAICEQFFFHFVKTIIL